MKSHVREYEPNVKSLNRGAIATITAAPNMLTNHDHRFMTAITLPNRNASRDSAAKATSRTALLRMPSDVIEETISAALLNNENKPIPAGPIHTATSLVRTMAHRILATCTPPNRPIAFTMVRDMPPPRFTSDNHFINIIGHSPGSQPCLRLYKISIKIQSVIFIRRAEIETGFSFVFLCNQMIE